MCNPLAIGLMVAGTALQANAQRKRQANMEDAAENARALEAARQDKMREERESVLVDSQQGMGREAQDAALAEAQAKREAAYASENAPDSATPGAYTGVATDSGTPKIVMDEVEKKRAEANADVRSVGDARARLGAYGDVNLGNRIANSNTGNTLGMLGGFARGSANLLSGEVQSAMNKHAGDRRGQELLGTALSMYGAAGAPAMFGGAAAGAGAGAGAYGTGLTAGQAASAVNTGAASTLGATAPGAGNAALGSNIAATMFPTAAQNVAPVAGAGIGGLFANGAPLFGSPDTKGYLPSWMNPRRGSI